MRNTNFHTILLLAAHPVRKSGNYRHGTLQKVKNRSNRLFGFQNARMVGTENRYFHWTLHTSTSKNNCSMFTDCHHPYARYPTLWHWVENM